MPVLHIIITGKMPILRDWKWRETCILVRLEMNEIPENIELSVAIPFYNEEANAERVVKSLIDELDRLGISFEIIMVNNGSRDTTGTVLDRLAKEDARCRPVHLIVNAGYGGGILTGLYYCQGRYLGYVWGDDQIKAADVVRVYESIRDGGVDWAKGRRTERHYGLERKIISRIYNFLFRLIFQLPTADANGVPKIFKRETYEKLDISSTDWFIDAEIIIKSVRQKFSFSEVPVVFHKREKGASSVNWLTVVEFVINMIRFGLGGGFGQGITHVPSKPGPSETVPLTAGRDVKTVTHT